jgi:O-antigen/teichoic acid export membrane protein
MSHPQTVRTKESATSVTSHQVARNSALYLGSLAIPAIAALFLVPVTVRSLGPARFGLLALAWAFAEGTGIFDFGLGKATIRFVADATARGAERVKQIVLASVFSQTAMGTLAGLLLFVLTPLLVDRVFKIGPALNSEAVAMFHVLALHMPVLLGTSALRASLEGAQRFDLSTSLRLPGSLASVVVPAMAARAGYSLAAILWILLGVRVILFLLFAIAVRRSLFSDRWTLPAGFATLREMLGYSGWVAISTALGPVLASFDRFVLGSIVGVTGLGLYTGAAEAANRFLLIPVTAFSAILPALAATDAQDGRVRALRVTYAARRQLATLMLPLCLTLFVFAPTILRVWLGPAYATASGTALRILSVGIFLTGLAVLPLALLYGSGRPDLPAKINLVQVAVHVPLTIALVRAWGITGAALSVTIRCAEDFVLYEWATRVALGRVEPDRVERSRETFLLWGGLGLVGTLALAARLHESWTVALSIATVGLVAYSWLSWSRVLSATERRAWMMMFSPIRAAIR